MDIFSSTLNDKNKNQLGLGLIITSLILLVILQFHNSLTHPINRGFDATGHIAYINYIKNNHQIPLPYQNFLFSHQPLYYLIVSLLPSLRLVKIFGFGIWLLFGFLFFLFLKKTSGLKKFSLMPTLLVMALPVMLYQSISISNEFLGAFFIMSSLIYYVGYLRQNKLKDWLILSILTGLAILTKATGLILIPVIILNEMLIWFDHGRQKTNLRFVALYPLAVSIIGGWIYLRNWFLFANPLVTVVDFPEVFPLHQQVVPRTIKFLLSPMSLLKLDLFTSQHYSLLGGTFFSFFYDAHNVIIPVQLFSKIGAVASILALLLLASSMIGFWQTKKGGKKETVLVIFSLFLVIAYVLYNFKFPFYSTVKGSFIISLALPYGYYLAKFIKKYQKYILAFSFFTFAYIIVLVKAFWILAYWYR